MATRRDLVKTNANRMGLEAGVAGALTVGAVVLGASIGAPLLAIGAGVAGGIITGRKAWRWLRYRGEYGLKF